jgi:hypothetical protein
VGCLHHLPVEAFDVFFRRAKGRLVTTASCCSRAGGDPRPAGARCHRPLEREIGDGRARAAHADGGESRGADRRRRAVRQPEAHGFRLVAASRGWEMFQRALPASALDHIAMRYLHTRYGSTGNVVAALWQMQ